MIVGLGLDLCPVERGAQMLEKERFLERVFTPVEREYLAARGTLAAQSAAGLYAAKEAVLKALGTGIGPEGTALLQVEVTHGAYGAPQVRLTGTALSRLQSLGGARVHLTITHDGGMAAAAAIAEGE